MLIVKGIQRFVFFKDVVFNFGFLDFNQGGCLNSLKADALLRIVWLGGEVEYHVGYFIIKDLLLSFLGFFVLRGAERKF